MAGEQVLTGSLPKGSRGLVGRVALIVGASRGLGAALAWRLAAEGCTVIATYRRSNEEVARLIGSLPSDAGKVIPLAGDGADPSFCSEAGALLRRDHGRLDFLFCNAAPSAQPLWLDPEAAGRIVDYVQQSLTVATVPMTALLPLLESSGGWLVFSSSVDVRQPPAEWPHYISAKLAIEGLVATAVVEYTAVTGLIVRYPRLLTDFVSHLSGAKAVAPNEALTKVLDRVMGPAAPGRCEVLEIA
jgi:NAD(P)-dependent dehydrogenase (short-subunit alcohol dehydrogenase family)